MPATDDLPLGRAASAPAAATILVVDDDQALQETLEMALQDEGYRVLQAVSGMEGVVVARAHRPDVVLLDVMMPGITGFEVCMLLRSQAETLTIPIIFLSARADVRSRVYGLQTGADDYITKPFDLDELYARIDAVLRRAGRQTTHTTTTQTTVVAQQTITETRTAPAEPEPDA